MFKLSLDNGSITKPQPFSAKQSFVSDVFNPILLQSQLSNRTVYKNIYGIKSLEYHEINMFNMSNLGENN